MQMQRRLAPGVTVVGDSAESATVLRALIELIEANYAGVTDYTVKADT